MYATARKYLGISLFSLAAALPIHAQSHPHISPKELAYHTLQRIATHKINPIKTTLTERAAIKGEAHRQINGLADFLGNRDHDPDKKEIAIALKELKALYPRVRAEIIATTPYHDRSAVSNNFLLYYPGFLELFEMKQEFARR